MNTVLLNNDANFNQDIPKEYKMFPASKLCLFAILFGLLNPVAAFGAYAQHTVRIAKTEEAPVIDGKLEETVWQNASIFSIFKTMHPEPGLPPSEKTKIYLIYDHEKIYVGLKCYDSKPEQISANTAEKDNPANDDWVAFCLDTFNDELGAYFFMVNPLGVQSDGTLNADGSPSMAYTARWESAGELTSEGYSAEIAIPFKYVPFRWQENLVMGFKVARFIQRKSEEVDFPEILPGRGTHLSQFQKIELTGIAQSQVSSDLPVVDVNEKYLHKMQASEYHDVNTLDGRCQAWGDAAVIDYLLFPKHDVKNNNTIFYFEKNLNEVRVASLLEPMEYAEGKQISNLENFLARTQTAALIVILHDKIVYEKYFNGYQRDAIVTSFSVAKSFASALIGIAIDEGLIESVRDPITKYIPELKERDERFTRIKIRDLLLMASGIRYDEEPPHRDDEITYYHPNLRQAALDETVATGEPGKFFLYNNYHPLLIGMILERTTGKSVSLYMQEKLWQQLGMEFPGSWSTDSEKHGFEKMESGINARAIDFAKFGRLFLRKGYWGGKQVVSPKWVDQSTQPGTFSGRYYPARPFFQTEGGYYKYFWWGKKRPNGKSDFFALGNKGQYIYVSPQKDLIIVRNGIEFGIPSMVWVRLFYDLASKIQNND